MLTKEVCLVQKTKVHIVIKLLEFFLLFFPVSGKVGVEGRSGGKDRTACGCGFSCRDMPTSPCIADEAPSVDFRQGLCKQVSLEKFWSTLTEAASGRALILSSQIINHPSLAGRQDVAAGELSSQTEALVVANHQVEKAPHPSMA